MQPKIIFENKKMLAVEKPAGMVVNKADTTKNVFTLQEWVNENVHDQAFNTEDKNKYVINGYNKLDEFTDRSGIVHRLDKETSGIILIAKDVDTFIVLQNQFKNGVVKKTYVALVHGKLNEKEGKIYAPIGRLPWNRTRFGVFPEGRDALTHYKVLEYKMYGNEVLSYIEIYPQTGRTHQIRVHLQHINHPIFSDELYAGRKQSRKDRKVLPRHFLHASAITFRNPEGGDMLTLKSNLPEDLTGFLAELQEFTVD